MNLSKLSFFKKYHNVLIAMFFILGFIIPFNGYWLSGIFYFGLSWLGFFGFLTSFESSYLLHFYVLIGFAVPVFTSLTIFFYTVAKLGDIQFVNRICKTSCVLSIMSYFSYVYLTYMSILENDFSFSFFNQTLWFLSSLLCFFSLFKWSNPDIIMLGELPCNTLNIPEQNI